MATLKPTTTMTVSEILDRWPTAVRVFQELKTACVGCPMAPFDTMEDVARIYNLSLPKLMGALEAVAALEQSQPASEETDTRRR
ncbi:MAG: DUF1858 domain-containing protein [Candidatus Promineifilaceae bacterium]|nr:DUF1858 domain-containing protein [Candidatus Promineifilaceae bacterium]